VTAGPRARCAGTVTATTYVTGGVRNRAGAEVSVSGTGGLTGVSQDNAEFFAASWEPCLRAVAASTGSMTLAEDRQEEPGRSP
jgi:hypothetical protein